jgi:hypothetical protein
MKFMAGYYIIVRLCKQPQSKNRKPYTYNWNNHQSYTKEDNQATILLKEARKRGFILKKKIIDTKK